MSEIVTQLQRSMEEALDRDPIPIQDIVISPKGVHPPHRQTQPDLKTKSQDLEVNSDILGCKQVEHSVYRYQSSTQEANEELLSAKKRQSVNLSN